MVMVWEGRFGYLLAWALLTAVPSGLAASVARTTEHQHAAVENILDADDAQVQIATALQAEKERAREEAPHSLHLSLAKLGLPVPVEIQDLVAEADGSKKVTPADADHAAERLNKMLEEQHVLLDHKVIDCRQKRRNAGEAIQEASAEVRNLASETSSARSIIVEATSRIPQDRRSFEEFKAEAEVSRSRCQSLGLREKVKAKSLERDAQTVAGVHEVLKKQCAASFAQQPGAQDDIDDVIASAESTLHGAPIAPIKLVESAAVESASSAKQSNAAVFAGCPGVAAALGVVAKKRGGRVAAAFLQQMQPKDCKLTVGNCAAMLDMSAEIAGEISDSQARLRATSARGRQACKDEDLFAKNQLTMETSQASDRSRELGEATWKAGNAGDLTNRKDSQRQKLQSDLKAITAKCTAEISGILYGKMCTLQKVRDSLQILAGRKELPEDCQVTDWDQGVCSATCGGGQKTLTRKVLLTPKGGASCPPLSLTLQCGETACPKDCQVSGWSGWSSCSARCDGGVQERNRAVSAKPLGNGVACPHLVDMRLCNTDACSSDCELLQWTPWNPCSKACEGGTQKRSRGLRDEGKASCPASDSQDRLELRQCNQGKCDDSNDVTCAGAPLDVVLLLDASGSMTKEGFNTVRDLSKELVKHYSPSEDGAKISVATFAKQAFAVSSLSHDASELSDKLDTELRWLEGPGNAGVGLSRASSLLAAGGRKKASSLVLMITDGRLVDPFLARHAADKLKQSGARLVFVTIGTDFKNDALLEDMASTPEKDNVIKLPGFKDLRGHLKQAAKRIVVSTCSAVV